MSTTAQLHQNQKIYWPQVISLLLLDFAVIISWIAYHEYQPIILDLFGFDALAFEFSIWQGIVVVITPAIAGYIADQQLKKSGKRLPIINVGINVVAMIFMAVALTVYIQPQGWIRWLVPIFITGWLICMNIFRSPAISLIERFVPQKLLPAVLALFVLTFDVAYALEPIIVDILSFLGGPITFFVGGILIFSTGFYLKKSFKKVENEQLDDSFNNDTDNSSSRFGVVVVLSLVLGLFTMVVLKLIPQVYASTFDIAESFLGGRFIGSTVLVLSALIALYVGKKVNQENIVNIALVGAVGFAISFGIFYSFPAPSIIIFTSILMAIFFSLISVTALPLALYELSSTQTIFGIGIFYGIAELADQAFNVLSMLP